MFCRNIIFVSLGLNINKLCINVALYGAVLLGALIAKYKNKLIVFIVIVLKHENCMVFICDFTFYVRRTYWRNESAQ